MAATTFSPNGFTYTYGHNNNGAINNVLRSDGKKVDAGDLDFQNYLVAVAAAAVAAAKAALLASAPLAAVASGQTAAQSAASAAVKAFTPDTTQSDHNRLVALEAWVANVQKTGLV